jgi:hypothetical protein
VILLWTARAMAFDLNLATHSFFWLLECCCVVGTRTVDVSLRCEILFSCRKVRLIYMKDLQVMKSKCPCNTQSRLSAPKVSWVFQPMETLCISWGQQHRQVTLVVTQGSVQKALG